jgi:hypothetical protein
MLNEQVDEKWNQVEPVSQNFVNTELIVKRLQDLCQTSFIDSANSRSKTRADPSDSIQEL